MIEPDNDDGHPIPGMLPYVVEGRGVCTPPPEPQENES